MQKIAFQNHWTCAHLNTPNIRKAVSLPHDAQLDEKRTNESLGGVNTGWFEGFDYIYEKTFFIPEEYEKKNISFEFEGVYHNAEVYINGKKAGGRPYGYSNFYIEVNEYLKYGFENQMQVIARNADQPNSRWYSGAGIYRPVWMYVAEPKHILRNGLKIKTVSIQAEAMIEIWLKANQPGIAKIQIYEADHHTIVAEKEVILREMNDGGHEAGCQILIPTARLWSVNDPYCYICDVTFGEDSATETFGIRTIDWSGHNGFLINGERMILRGACIHHDNGILGACAYPEAEERKIRILKENGYNAVRSAHNPCSKALLDACDKLGMLVLDEFVDVWYIHKTEYDYVNYFEEWWQQDLADMVDKNYNHPSVIMYSTGNEVSETAQEKGIRLTGQMTDFLHELDDTRPVTCGINIFFNYLSSIGLGVYSDKKVKKEAEKNPGKTKAVGSEFFNQMAGILGSTTMKTGATLRGCDRKTRGAFAQMDIAGYNYGIFRYKKDLKKYPKRLILGSETFCDDAYRFWELAKKEPRLVGDFVWAGMDYLGEVGVGAWEYKDDAPEFDHRAGWITAGSGRIDLTGKPLAEAEYTKVAFEMEAGPVIAVRPVNHTDEKHSPSAWKMTNAICSWSWHGWSGKKAVVEVYARAYEVRLFINGTLVGSHKIKNDCKTSFKTVYQDGTVEAAAYDVDGREIGRTALHTADVSTQISILPEEDRLKAGRLAFIRIKYTDKDGITKPLEKGRLRLELEHASLLGFGNACSYHALGYRTDQSDTYYGEALAVICPKEQGSCRIKVSDSIREAVLELSVEA